MRFDSFSFDKIDVDEMKTKNDRDTEKTISIVWFVLLFKRLGIWKMLGSFTEMDGKRDVHVNNVDCVSLNATQMNGTAQLNEYFVFSVDYFDRFY